MPRQGWSPEEGGLSGTPHTPTVLIQQGLPDSPGQFCVTPLVPVPPILVRGQSECCPSVGQAPCQVPCKLPSLDMTVGPASRGVGSWASPASLVPGRVQGFFPGCAQRQRWPIGLHLPFPSLPTTPPGCTRAEASLKLALGKCWPWVGFSFPNVKLSLGLGGLFPVVLTLLTPSWVHPLLLCLRLFC